MCRAHGLAHQRVTQPGELAGALKAARGLNKHSVVEVITNRETNVAQHRAIQDSVRAAVRTALSKFHGSASASAPPPHLPPRRTVLARRHRKLMLECASYIMSSHPSNLGHVP